MAGATIAVNIVSSERPVWSGEAKQVVVPAYAGGMGILPGHEPVLSVIEDAVWTSQTRMARSSRSR